MQKKARFAFIGLRGCMNMVGEKQSLNPKWKLLRGDSGLEEPTPLKDRVYLECTQREAKADY